MFYEIYLENIKLHFYQKNLNFLNFILLKLMFKVNNSNIIAHSNIAHSNITMPTVFKNLDFPPAKWL
jgi:hypothetical protein